MYEVIDCAQNKNFEEKIFHFVNRRNDYLCCFQMLAYMHAQNAYFHQGFDLFADLEPYMKTIASQVRNPPTHRL